MPVLERCRMLRNELVRRDTLVREVRNAQVFIERAQEIRELRNALGGSVEKIETLRKHGIPVAKVPDSTVVVQRLSRYRQVLETDPAESGREHGNSIRTLDNLCKAFEQASKAAIDLVHRLPSVDERFLKQVEANPAARSTVVEIRKIRAELERLGSKALTSETLTVFLEKRTALQALAQRLNPEDFPKEVLEFFKAAQQGASLDKLTTTVRDWLDARGQLSSLRIFIVEQ